MSWPLASFVLLFVALAAGFAWYERSAPSSRTLALVATLAALAVVGRIAFAPFPNVKPMTDIVLLAGYALGGAPGFAVGAVGALASNIVFGQGPWTPWQMGAWGLCGIAGAVLATLSGRRMGRVGLAVSCGLAGLAFGAIMDFSTWVTFSGQHTLSQYVAISAASGPFNIAHAVGNVLFCLAFGPVLLRSLARYRARLEVSWRPLAAAAVVAVVAASALSVPAPAEASTASRAAAYVRSAQVPDGGFGSARGRPATALDTAWAAMGLRAAGGRCNARLVGALRRDAARARSTGDVERVLLALGACGKRDVRLTRVLIGRRGARGAFERQVTFSAFAILALRAQGRPRRDPTIRRAAAYIATQQNRDGGFNVFGRPGPSGIDDTASAMQALVAAGRSRRSGPVARAVRFLAARQNRDGGYPLSPGGGSNAQSTAWAVQALVAGGRDPERQRRRGARSPLAFIRSLQAPDGSIRYSRTSGQTPVWVTSQALTALGRRPFPVT